MEQNGIDMWKNRHAGEALLTFASANEAVWGCLPLQMKLCEVEKGFSAKLMRSVLSCFFMVDLSSDTELLNK